MTVHRALSLVLAVATSISPLSANAGDIATYLGQGAPANLYLDQGHLWFHNNDCTTSGWQYLEEVPGAHLVDCEEGDIVFTTDVGYLLAGYLNVFAPPHFYNTIQIGIPSEVGSIVDISLASAHNGDSRLKAFLQTATNELWSVTYEGAAPPSWSGPCDLPSGPVSLDENSWGGIKSQYRVERGGN